MDSKVLFSTYYENMYNGFDIDPGIWMSNYIADRMEMNDEQVIWFCFLNSMTYHLPTAYLFINEFPDLENVDIDRVTNWWKANKDRVPFQKDKSKPTHRTAVPETIRTYKQLIIDHGGSQKSFFDKMLSSSPHDNFNYVYDKFSKHIMMFGRFSTWNMAQMLKQVYGYNCSPDDLMLGNTGGWKSHTHGLCIAVGHEELTKIDRPYTTGEKEMIHAMTEEMMLHTRTKVPVDPYLLETVACAYKKLFRNHDSRYLGYYLDRQADDIRQLESMNWTGINWQLLWDARREVLGDEYRDATLIKDRYLESPDLKIFLEKERVKKKSLFS
jgi:hypothetical protein